MHAEKGNKIQTCKKNQNKSQYEKVAKDKKKLKRTEEI